MEYLKTDEFKTVKEILEKEQISYTDIKRYMTGYCHQVYYVKEIKNEYVLRISSPEVQEHYLGSLEWYPALYDLGLPVPEIIYNGTHNEYSYTIMTYIKGKDLGEVYGLLSDNEKLQLAKDIVKIQKALSAISSKGYYGCSIGEHYDSWADVVLQSITRSKRRIVENGVFEEAYCDNVMAILERFYDYLSSIGCIPFLDDITTKNVMVHNGQLAGIVDLDGICYGDSLFTVALTNMALLNEDFDNKYIEYWLDEMQVTDIQRKAVLFYTLVFCIDFMGEQGMSFPNGIKVYNEAKIHRLKKIYGNLIARLNE